MALNAEMAWVNEPPINLSFFSHVYKANWMPVLNETLSDKSDSRDEARINF